jgi:cephalosporin-C deacetylase
MSTRSVYFYLLMLGCAVMGLARPVWTQPPVNVNDAVISLSPGGGLDIKAPDYQARVGSDGNLHSLRVGDTEMIDDKTAFSLGAFFYADDPVRLGSVTVNSPTPGAVHATDGVHTIDYKFLPGEIRMTLSQTADKKHSFLLVVSDQVSVVTNTATGAVSETPTEVAWANVKFTARSGANITLRGGDQLLVAKPGTKRQIWALEVAAGTPREISIAPAVGPPPQPTMAELISMSVDAGNDKVLGSGEPAALAVMVENRGDAVAEALLTVALKRLEDAQPTEISQEISLGAKSQTSNRFDIALLQPGIYIASAKLAVGDSVIKEASSMLAFRPEEIKPPINMPADYADYWRAVMAEVPAKAGDTPPQFTEDTSLSSSEIKVWKVTFTGAKGLPLNGWLCAPNRTGRHAALLQLPNYGRPKIEASDPVALASRGYVAMAVELVPEGSDIAYLAHNLENENNYAYRDIMINCLRALNLLEGRPEVDPQRVALLGTAQGGGLAVLAAAMRQEVAALAIDTPMLCNLPYSIKNGTGYYTDVADYLKAHPDAERRVAQTLGYFDAVNAAPRVQKPVLVSLGLKDTFCRPETIYEAYNALAGTKEMKVYPDAGHEGDRTHWIYKLQWLDALLKPNVDSDAPNDKPGEPPVAPAG